MYWHTAQLDFNCFVPALFFGVKLQSLHHNSRIIKPYLFNILFSDEEANCSPCSSETWDNNWHYFNRCYKPSVRSRYTCRNICIKSLANFLNFVCSNMYFTLAPPSVNLTMGFSIVTEHCSIIIIYSPISGCDHISSMTSFPKYQNTSFLVKSLIRLRYLKPFISNNPY